MSDNEPEITRKDLVTATFSQRTIDRVELKEITLGPVQRTPYHLHSGGVIGYVLAGEVRFCVEGQPERRLVRGEGFFEPPGAPITSFANASAENSCTFLACYPLLGDETVITMLE